MHERRWTIRREGAHWSTWRTRLQDTARLRRILSQESWSPTGPVAKRRALVTNQLSAIERKLLQTPSRAWMQPRVIDIRRRVA